MQVTACGADWACRSGDNASNRTIQRVGRLTEEISRGFSGGQVLCRRRQEHAAAEPGSVFEDEAGHGIFSHVDAEELSRTGQRLMGEDPQSFSAKTVPAIHEQQMRAMLWDTE